MANKKHYILTSITLGAIAATSALLIGGANMLTRNKIAENELNRIYNGIAEIFGDSAAISSETSIEKDTYKYVEYVYEIKVNDNESGYAFRTTGSNMYGKISLIVGFNLNNEFIKMSVITDEQTYKSTLENKYISKVNDSSRDVEDVSCGATYGAKLVRDMINEAKQASNDKAWK